MIELVGHGPAQRFDGLRMQIAEYLPVLRMPTRDLTTRAVFDLAADGDVDAVLESTPLRILTFRPRLGSWAGDEGQLFYDWDGRIE